MHAFRRYQSVLLSHELVHINTLGTTHFRNLGESTSVIGVPVRENDLWIRMLEIRRESRRNGARKSRVYLFLKVKHLVDDDGRSG
jgi:hypothetical protein